MCFPLAIPLALMAAGTVAKFFGDKQAQKAQNRTFNNERNRQKAFEGEQTAAFQDSLDKTAQLTDPNAQAAATAAREDALTHAIVSASPAAGGYLPGSSSAPAVVATAADKAGAKSDATSQSLAHALATLGGTTDALQTNDINIGRNSQHIGQINSFKSGSLGVLQAEMDAAKQKGSFLRGIGGLAQTIGSMMASGGGLMGGGFSPSAVSVGSAAPLANLGTPSLSSIFGSLPSMGV